MSVTILFRPVGTAELDLIRLGGSKGFPPRLADQPIFYPVTNGAYAAQIARDWNARHNTDKRGYVTRFAIDSAYLSRFPVQTVGGREHTEYWVPAEQLEEFNAHIIGSIEVIATFGPGSVGGGSA